MSTIGITARASAAVVALLVGLTGTTALADGAIHGRVWIGNTPAINVKVAVYEDHSTRDGSLDRSKQIAATIVSDKSGTAEDGYYEINGLPTGRKLMIVAIYPVFPKDPAVQKISLREGERKKVNLTIEKRLPDKG